MFDLEPQGNYILVEVTGVTLSSGIQLLNYNTDDKKPRPYGLITVLKVGQGKLIENGTRVPIAIKPGDRVIVHQLAYKSGRIMPLEASLFGGRELMLVDAGDVISIQTGEYESPPPAIMKATPKQTKQLLHA